jgi:hypothetical protein
MDHARDPISKSDRHVVEVDILMRSHYIKQELVKLIANFTGVVLNVLSK